MRRLAIVLFLVACAAPRSGVTIADAKASAQDAGAGTLYAVPSLDDVLAWLPDDTVSVAVANGPLAYPRSARDDPEPDPSKPLSREQIERLFSGLALGLFGLPNGGSFEGLVGREVKVAVTGIARFRTPQGLGEGPYDGCSIAVFATPVHGASGTFSEKQERDTWTTHVAFPTDHVALVCTDTAYMDALVGRMHTASRKPTFAPDAPVWKHVDVHARFWGMHVAGQESVAFAVRDALTVASIGPGPEETARKLGSETKDSAMHEARRDGALVSTYSLGASGASVFMYTFYVLNMLGHVIFL